MCCCAPFVGHIPPMSLQNPKFPSKLNRTEMADEAELFCTSASKTVVFARLLVSVNDLHRGLSSSVFRVEQITQNPVVAIPYRFDPGHRHQKIPKALRSFRDFFICRDSSFEKGPPWSVSAGFKRVLGITKEARRFSSGEQKRLPPKRQSKSC